ncbi:16157_t:CDS:2, partial [Racocetra persica]
MEKILHSLLASNHHESVKKKFVEKLTTPKYEMPESDWEKLCNFSYDLLLEHTTRVHAEVGEYILAWVARTQTQLYMEYFNSDDLKHSLEQVGAN